MQREFFTRQKARRNFDALQVGNPKDQLETFFLCDFYGTCVNVSTVFYRTRFKEEDESICDRFRLVKKKTFSDGTDLKFQAQ